MPEGTDVVDDDVTALILDDDDVTALMLDDDDVNGGVVVTDGCATVKDTDGG